jgi:hypothetical protein
MKYLEVKKLLNDAGFTLETVQTSSDLEMLSFYHPTIDGEIFVDFGHNIDIPQDILDGRSFSYDDEKEEWLMNLTVNMVQFDIDVSISFMSEDTLDVCGNSYENSIILYGEDVNLVPKVLSIIIDKYTFMKFQREYTEEMNKFFSWVETFIPTFDKYNLKPSSFPTSGNETTLYRNIALRFSKTKTQNIDFYFNILTWRKSIAISIEPGFLNENAFLNENCTIEEFQTELERQWDVLIKFENRCEID